MPRVISIHRTSDKLYDYSMGLFYTLMPNGLPKPLPEQKQFMSSGINRGVYKNREEIIEQMTSDILNSKFAEDIFYAKDKSNNYYIINEFDTTDDDIYYCDSNPPSEGDKFILQDNKLIKIT